MVQVLQVDKKIIHTKPAAYRQVWPTYGQFVFFLNLVDVACIQVCLIVRKL